jgi:predicted GTPase
MKGLSGQFESVKKNVQAREAALMLALDRLSNSLKLTVGSVASDRLAQGNPLMQAARNADEKVAARLFLWRKRIEQYDRNTEFREDFGDSLLVYIYGKVKAGKSSLGNYVAYGHGDPDPAVIRATQEGGTQPAFFMRDAANSSELAQKEKNLHERGKFFVGSMEATTEIQGFRLPGLTWIDSPGLHSVTPENGDLSKSYADAADLILYPMNSGQPGRASDLAEIAGLLHARKAFVVVISRCDTVDVDFDDEGNEVKTRLMKTPKDRQDQIDYVRQEILAKAETVARELLDADVITISVSYAQEHADDPTMLCESGMSGFFEKLTSLTQAQGVALKRGAPLNNLRTFVDLILDDEELSVKGMRADLKTLEGNITRQRNSLERMQRAVTGRVMLDLNPAIEKEVIQHQAGRNVGALSRACSKLVQEIVVRHTTEALAEVLLDTQASINAAVKFDEFKDLPEFRDLTQDVTLSNEGKGRALGGALGTLIAGIGVALAIPTGGATLLVTGAASTAAALAGNWIGAKAGGAMASETTITVNVGDNTREVIAETTRIASEAAQLSVIAAFKKLDQDFLTPVETRSRDIVAALDYFETTLVDKVRPNEI